MWQLVLLTKPIYFVATAPVVLAARLYVPNLLSTPTTVTPGQSLCLRMKALRFSSASPHSVEVQPVPVGEADG